MTGRYYLRFSPTSGKKVDIRISVGNAMWTTIYIRSVDKIDGFNTILDVELGPILRTLR